MNFLRRSIDFIFFGNIYVAFGASLLALSTCIELGLESNLFYLLIVYFSTLMVYNLQRVYYKKFSPVKYGSPRREWISKNLLAVKTLAAIGFAGTSVMAVCIHLKAVIFLLPLFAVSLSYFLPSVQLRKKPWFKLLTLVAVWTAVTAVGPILLNNETIFNLQNLLHIFSRLFFIIGICIPFDIRDQQFDRQDGVITIPQIVGEQTAKRLAMGSITIYMMMIVLQFFLGTIQLITLCFLTISAIITLIIIAMSGTKRSEYFYLAAVDGTMILQGLMVIAANYL